jgi:hypothetical protein
MIPCEILKKIRQIELRTNRLVIESAGRSLMWINVAARRAYRQNENV